MKPKIKWLLLIVVLLTTGLVATGCVKGLAPIGWSGGAVSGDRLYIGSEEGRLVAVNLADDSRQWSDAIKPSSSPGLFGCSPATGGGCGSSSAGVPIYGNPVVVGNNVYITGYNGKVYSYLMDTLQEDREYPVGSSLEPIVGGLVTDNQTVYFGDADGKVYALNADNFQEKWSEPYQTGDKIWATGALDGNTLFIGSFDNSLYALDTGDGHEKWSYTTEGAIMATPLVNSGTVYIGSLDRNLYALNAADGSLKWKFNGGNWFWARPYVSNGSVYAGCLDGKIYVLDAGNGNLITDFDVNDGISSNPVIMDSRVIFATRKGQIYAVDTASNEIKLIISLDNDVYGPLTAHENVIYIHLQDMTLQRVNADSGALLRSIVLKVAE